VSGSRFPSGETNAAVSVADSITSPAAVLPAVNEGCSKGCALLGELDPDVVLRDFVAAASHKITAARNRCARLPPASTIARSNRRRRLYAVVAARLKPVFAIGRFCEHASLS
jgi:hypothetical protein